MTHHIKLSHHYADAVLSGQKNFEVRYNDRGYQRGDKVCFQVVDDCKTSMMSHPLNRETFIITYLVHGYGLEKDWCAFGIRPLKKEAEPPSGCEDCKYWDGKRCANSNGKDCHNSILWWPKEGRE